MYISMIMVKPIYTFSKKNLQEDKLNYSKASLKKYVPKMTNITIHKIGKILFVNKNDFQIDVSTAIYL